MNNYYKTVKITGQERALCPTLLQTFHATVSSKTFSSAVYSDSRYIEPTRRIILSHPIILKPDAAAFYLQAQGYIFYGENHLYRRCIDGRLTELRDETETDRAAEIDFKAISSYQRCWTNVSVLGLDLNNNVYCIGRREYHNILVCSQDGTIYGKFHLMGGPTLWYLTPDGKVCILTSNGAADSGKKKNILRLYRLDLPEEY